MSDNHLPWHRQKDEPANLFEMFEYYLNLGSERTLYKISARFSVSDRSVSNYSKKWDWVKRVNLFEDYLRENIRYPMLDQLRDLETKKLAIKIVLSDLSLEITDSIKGYLDINSPDFKNEDIRLKLKFLREVAHTIKQLMSMAGFSLDAALFKVTKNGNTSKAMTPFTADNSEPNISAVTDIDIMLKKITHDFKHLKSNKKSEK